MRIKAKVVALSYQLICILVSANIIPLFCIHCPSRMQGYPFACESGGKTIYNSLVRGCSKATSLSGLFSQISALCFQPGQKAWRQGRRLTRGCPDPDPKPKAKEQRTANGERWTKPATTRQTKVAKKQKLQKGQRRDTNPLTKHTPHPNTDRNS